MYSLIGTLRYRVKGVFMIQSPSAAFGQSVALVRFFHGKFHLNASERKPIFLDAFPEPYSLHSPAGRQNAFGRLVGSQRRRDQRARQIPAQPGEKIEFAVDVDLQPPRDQFAQRTFRQ